MKAPFVEFGMCLCKSHSWVSISHSFANCLLFKDAIVNACEQLSPFVWACSIYISWVCLVYVWFLYSHCFTICLGVQRYPPTADYDNLEYFRSQISILNDGTLLAGAM